MLISVRLADWRPNFYNLLLHGYFYFKFKSAPDFFTQVCTVHVLYNDGWHFPIAYINLIITDTSFLTRLCTVAFIDARYAASRSGFYSLLCIYTSSPPYGMVVQVPCSLETAPEDHLPFYNRTNRDLRNCLANPGSDDKHFLNIAQLHLLYS